MAGKKEGKKRMRGGEWERGKDSDTDWGDSPVCSTRIHNAYFSFMASVSVLTLRDDRRHLHSALIHSTMLGRP